jgi:thermopsin
VPKVYPLGRATSIRMIAPRNKVVIAVLLTAVLAFSSLGVLGATFAQGPGGASSVPGASPATAASTASAPTSLTGAPGASGSHLTSRDSALSKPTLPATSEATAPRSAQILNALAAKGVSDHDVFLPYLLNGPHPALSNGHVNLTYQSSPAPYGIGEFGLKNVSGVVTPYTLSTPSVEANFSTALLDGYSADISGPDEWGVQLNAVLNDVTILGHGGDQFWTQNVIEYTPSNSSLTFISNIWNFSAYDAPLSCNTFFATDGYVECPEYFYGESAPISVSFPFAVNLYLNSALENGRDAVYFNYTIEDGSGSQSGTYCYAIFNSLGAGGNPGSTVAPLYVASGFGYNPYGLPDDFEVTLGGPGGGSNFDVAESEWTYMGLQYWNSTRGSYLTVPSAFNVGGDTGETSVGVNVAWSSFSAEGAGAPSEAPASCIACVTLSNGPSFQYGLWSVLGAGVGGYSPHAETDWGDQSSLRMTLRPDNAFVFIADFFESITTPSEWEAANFSAYQWTPNFAPFTDANRLPVGNYTLIIVASNFNPIEAPFTVASNSVTLLGSNAPQPDPTIGVYTPLWAFNFTGLQNISSGKNAYNDYILYNNEYAPLGQIPVTSAFGTSFWPVFFPWFGLFNDFGFPVFPGVLLNDVAGVQLSNAPSFTVSPAPYPSYDLRLTQELGWPTTNSLQMFFWNVGGLLLYSSTISGWWPAVSYFGLSQSLANVQFWNTSSSVVEGNTFETGGMALWFYGGVYNDIESNVFESQGDPPSASDTATVAEEWGSIGLVDDDWGDADLYGAGAFTACDECDTIDNNAFDTVVTADSQSIDPYTGLAPNQYQGTFSQAWNGAYQAGVTNIIGGNYLGGNYWWDYGYADNPYGVLPDVETNWLPYDEGVGPRATICVNSQGNCGGGAGDYYPLTAVPIYNITFQESGLPSGTDWQVELYVPSIYNFQQIYEYNGSVAPGGMNFTESPGLYPYYPYSYDTQYEASEGVASVSNASIVVVVHFQAGIQVRFVETGLPAGSSWEADLYNDTTLFYAENSSTTPTVIVWALPGTYTEQAYPNGALYRVDVASPDNIEVTVHGTSVTVDVTFVTAYIVTFHVTGLPAYYDWYFVASASNGNFTGFGSALYYNITVGAGSFVWQVDSAGYAASPASGSTTISADTTISIVFVPVASATGTVSGTIVPGSATLWVDGSAVTVASGGTFSDVVPIGVTSVEVKEAGYATYFNNVTVTLGHTTSLTIDLTPVSSTSSSGAAGISGLGWALIGLLAALAAILLVTTLIFARRGRTPPSMQPYTATSPPPPPAAGAPPPGAAPPAWQEPPPPGGSA